MICKKLFRFVCIAILATILINPIPSNAYANISDIKDFWAEDVIWDWVNKGLANGYPDGTFKPNKSISRAEFMSLVNSAFEFTKEGTIDFKDVIEGKWYVSTIKRAKAAGYINGYDDGTMRPENPITREEVATIITKIINLEKYESGTEIFKDKDQMTWSRGYVGAVANEQYMVGFPDGTFRPINNITRGEALYALNNILGKAGVEIIAKQDFLGITYIHVVWNREINPSIITANGEELSYDKIDKKWKGTSLNLNIGDTVEIISIENGIEHKMSVVVKDLLDN